MLHRGEVTKLIEQNADQMNLINEQIYNVNDIIKQHEFNLTEEHTNITDMLSTMQLQQQRINALQDVLNAHQNILVKMREAFTENSPELATIIPVVEEHSILLQESHPQMFGMHLWIPFISNTGKWNVQFYLC